MKIKIDNNLKEAILRMPQKEKDRMLLRLIAKDSLLAHQLQFRLLEDEEDLKERKENIFQYIETRAEVYPEFFYSPGYLMMDMRDCSGLINDYRNITRDKAGEIELQLNMLNDLLEPNMDKLAMIKLSHKMKLVTYVVKRRKRIGDFMEKIHEDYRLEFEDDLEKLNKLITQLDPEGHILRSEGIFLG